MGSLLWSGNLESSPYSHLLSQELWTRVKESVAVDASRVSGLSRESILSVAFRVRNLTECLLCYEHPPTLSPAFLPRRPPSRLCTKEKASSAVNTRQLFSPAPMTPVSSFSRLPLGRLSLT